MISNPVILSVIVPVRITPHREEILQRVSYCLQDRYLPENIEFLIVDDGSAPELAEKLKNICRKNELKYLNAGGDSHQPFNLAKVRNYAARHAKGQFILFMDVDLMPYPGFYRDILIEAEVLEMTHFIDRFLMCPVLYLTDKAWELHAKKDEYLRKSFFINAMLSADRDLIEKYSHGTSVVLVDRHYYLSVGGQNEMFEGWGFEDYEFTTRLIRKNPQFPIPQNWSTMAGNFMTISQYSGWKAAYRLHGDWLGSKGIYLFHIPHNVDDSFKHHPGRNQKLLERQLKRGSQIKDPAALCYLDSGSSLMFAKNPFCYSREFAPSLGKIVMAKEKDIYNAAKLKNYIEEHHIDRIVFSNPYANKYLLAIYQWCKEQNFPLIVAERGALPDSVYHDRRGFLSDGDSYNPDKWNRPLSCQQENEVQAYIESIRYGSKMLESQSDRIGPEQLRKKLGIANNKKVLFIPFQQPNDTVVRYFSGPIDSFDNFHNVVSRLPSQLAEQWCVVYKKHPVEDEVSHVSGAINADEFNVYDLIEMADALVLINSGVGLYGMMFAKPVYILGDAWYKHEDMNVVVKDESSLASHINAGFVPDRNVVQRFIYYLRYEFYSFGHQFQRRARLENGLPTTATLNIDYYELRGWGRETFYFTENSAVVGLESPLFDRYRSMQITTQSKLLKNRNSSVAKLKLKKLKERPLQFFIDGIKNRFR